MKMIAFGDVHMTLGRFDEIPGIESAELVILTGDLTNYGDRHEAKKILDRVMEVNPNVLAQAGNLDEHDVDRYLEELDFNLHGHGRLIGDECCLLGVGGSNQTPFNTPIEYSEEEIDIFLQQANSEARELVEAAVHKVGRPVPLILVAHTPPHNCSLDQIGPGQHVGSTSVRRFIERFQPPLCITGHIHEASGEERIGKTLVINPGMIQHHGWVEVEVGQGRVEAGFRTL
ncbi:MAG: metallophosphoesterase [Thermodesulfobacteriota bacterium]